MVHDHSLPGIECQGQIRQRGRSSLLSVVNIGRLSGVLQKHKWENCMPIDKWSWGYRRNAVLADYLTPHDIITRLVETVRYVAYSTS